MKNTICFFLLLLTACATKVLNAQGHYYPPPDLRMQLYSDSSLAKYFDSSRYDEKFAIDSLIDKIKNLDIEDFDSFLVKYNFCSYFHFVPPCESYFESYKNRAHGHLSSYLGLTDTMLFRCFQNLYENNAIPEDFVSRFQRQYATWILNSQAVVVAEIIGWHQPIFESKNKEKLPKGVPPKRHLLKVLEVPYTLLDINVGDTIVMNFDDGITNLSPKIENGDTTWVLDAISWSPSIPSYFIGDTIVPILHRRGRLFNFWLMFNESLDPNDLPYKNDFSGHWYTLENIHWDNNPKPSWYREPKEIERFIQFLKDNCE